MDLDLERLRSEMKGRDGGCTYSEANLLINEIERLRAELVEEGKLIQGMRDDLFKAYARIAELETTVASQKDLVESLLGRIAKLGKVREVAQDIYKWLQDSADKERLHDVLAALKEKGSDRL